MFSPVVIMDARNKCGHDNAGGWYKQTKRGPMTTYTPQTDDLRHTLDDIVDRAHAIVLDAIGSRLFHAKRQAAVQSA